MGQDEQWGGQRLRQDSGCREAGSPDHADGSGGGEKQMEPRCIQDLTRRGLSVGLDVEGRKSCITAFWGELRSRGMVPPPDIGKAVEGRMGVGSL